MAAIFEKWRLEERLQKEGKQLTPAQNRIYDYINDSVVETLPKNSPLIKVCGTQYIVRSLDHCITPVNIEDCFILH